MKNLIALFFVCSICSFLSAQNKTHRIGRGETLESIASLYNVSTEDLIETNPSLRVGVHLGMDITIPSGMNTIASTAVSNSANMAEETQRYFDKMGLYMEYMQQGSSYYNDSKYSKAQKAFLAADQLMNSPSARYNYALCLYQKGQYKKARDEFSSLEWSDDATEDIKNSAKEMYEAAEIKLEERRQTWAEIGAALLLTTAAVASYATAAYTASTYGYSPNLSFMANPYFALAQVNSQTLWTQQMQLQQMNMLSQQQIEMHMATWNTEMQAALGRFPTSDEYWAAFSSMPAYVPPTFDSSSASYSSYSSSSSFEGSDLSNISSSSSSQCKLCHGTGQYFKEHSPNFGLDLEKHWCDICQQYDTPHYHTTCPSCRGR